MFVSKSFILAAIAAVSVLIEAAPTGLSVERRTLPGFSPIGSKPAVHTNHTFGGLPYFDSLPKHAASVSGGGRKKTFRELKNLPSGNIETTYEWTAPNKTVYTVPHQVRAKAPKLPHAKTYKKTTASVSNKVKPRSVLERRDSCVDPEGGSTFRVSDVYGESTKVAPGGLVGKLQIQGGGWCTATLIGPKHLLTAAHCVFGPNGWYQGWTFTPGEDNQVDPWGSYEWNTVVAMNEYIETQVFDYDMALIELKDSHGGYANFGYDSDWKGKALNAWGYPYNHENEMWAADGTYSILEGNVLKTNNPICSGHSGSSGWLVDDPTTARAIVSYIAGNLSYFSDINQEKYQFICDWFSGLGISRC